VTSFCRFTVGAEGTSAANVRYASRRDAVRERGEGVFFRNAPDEAWGVRRYGELRDDLEAYAWAREESEQARHRARGGGGVARSHYRCVLSFEGAWTTAAIRRLVEPWLEAAVPQGIAMCFVHRNTEHVHVHVWLDARGIDGKKLDFSPKEWRSIGAKWDRLYQRELARRERLETRILEREGGKDEQGRDEGAGGRAPGGASHEPAQAGPLAPEEPAARECAQSRGAAVRGAEELRRALEELGPRQRAAEPHDRERKR